MDLPQSTPLPCHHIHPRYRQYNLRVSTGFFTPPEFHTVPAQNCTYPHCDRCPHNPDARHNVNRNH